MPIYSNGQPPEITQNDLPRVIKLLQVFDKITFNTDAEIVAVLTTDLPIIGKVLISLYDRGNHLQVRRDGDDTPGGIWNGYLRDLLQTDTLDRNALIKRVRGALRDQILKQLA